MEKNGEMGEGWRSERGRLKSDYWRKVNQECGVFTPLNVLINSTTV